jgi:hypothetical protein
LEKFGGAVEAAQQGGFEDGADERGGGGGGEDAEDEEFGGAGEAGEDGPGDVGAEHVEAAMGEVHHPGHAENHRQAGGDQEEGRGAGEAGEELEESDVHSGAQEDKGRIFFL